MEKNLTRPKTNSITHLVKIVAREVVVEELRTRFKNQHRNDNELLERINELGRNFFGTIQTSLEKTGTRWLAEEDELLVQEVRTALSQIAKNHSRSVVAIRSRISQKELI